MNILESVKFVVESSQSVKIDQTGLKVLTDAFKFSDFKHWLSESPFGLSILSDEEKLHFLVILNSISFCYWGEPKWTVDYRGEKYDGAFGMILALVRAVNEGVPILDFKYCATISKNDLAVVLRGNTQIPLIEERWKILREVGSKLTEKFNGSAADFFRQAEGDEQKILTLIAENFSSFSDWSAYKQNKVYFYKRAQLLASDLFQLFGKLYLKDVDTLTACADYKLPQILRKFGVLEYSPELAEKIDNKTTIPHNSEQEVEIRANTVWAVELIKENLKAKHLKVSSMDINDFLWLASQNKLADDKPYHRTLTTAY